MRRKKKPGSRQRRTAKCSLADFFKNICAERCSKKDAIQGLLFDNFVSISISGDCSHRRQIEMAAAHALRPIPIQSIAAELAHCGHSIRGKTIFGNVADQIDDLVGRYQNMSWWIDQKGLTVAETEASLALSRFDSIVGQEMAKRFQNGRLERGALEGIAAVLDQRRICLRDSLRPSGVASLNLHNQKSPKRIVETFEQAVKFRPQLRRAVQRSFYAAHERFMKKKT